MMKQLLITNGHIINEDTIIKADILIEDKIIKKIILPNEKYQLNNDELKIIDADGLIVLPGIIDDQVHFRDPGLTHKGDLYTESKAAIAGGITSFFEMPNTIPQTITQKLLEEKYNMAATKSLANFSFYLGATNDNIEEIVLTNPRKVCGIKVFMGSSTGNMLVDNPESLKRIFSKSPLLIATHCEDETIIQNNSILFKEKYGEDVPIEMHDKIRSEEACYKSSSLAIELARKHGTRLHILHLSTAIEAKSLDNSLPSKQKRITGEVCIHHLWFDNTDYKKFGSRIKWNPAIKTTTDKQQLFELLLNGNIDVIATDHAPHTIPEKSGKYFSAASGGPLVQHSLVTMLEFYHNNKISLEKIVEKMCHAPADIFKVSKRGYIKEGYYADFTIVDLKNSWTVNTDNLLYKCGWSPFIGMTYKSKVIHTIVNGHHIYNDGFFNETEFGMRILFDR